MSDRGAVLCVGNFRASTGYAWTFINALYGGVCRAAKARGMRTWVCYWDVNAEPAGIGDAAEVVELDARCQGWRSMLDTLRFIRRERVRVLYLSDRAAWSPLYCLFRLVGVRRIVVHHHRAAGDTVPTGLRRWVKIVRRYVPGANVDAAIAVSDYVVRTRERVALTPGIRRIWNYITPPEHDRTTARRLLRAEFGIAPERPVIGCCARAGEGKGVDHLLRAFDRLDHAERPVLVYFGDGPYMDEIRVLHQAMAHRESVVLAGYRTDAPTLIGGVDVAVVPSTINEAFPLAALEPMAYGVPVIASDVGGLPEAVDGVGLLVPPGDVDALAVALSRLLSDPAEREAMGTAAQARTRERFAPGAQLAAVSDIVLGHGRIESGFLAVSGTSLPTTSAITSTR